MDILATFEPWWRFGAALLIGALIGLEREFVQQKSGDPDFAGIRTFSLIALLGAAAAHLSVPYGVWPFLVAYLAVAAIVWANYNTHARARGFEGVTTEIAALLVPLLSALVIWGEAELGVALGVLTALLLSLKPGLHDLARRMSTQDLRAMLEFGLVSAVILPILPDQNLGPFNVVNPFKIWLLVVFVSGIGLLGYVLTKTLGAKRGIGLAGVLGGLASSTATTISFAERSRDEEALSDVLAQGILLSSSVMFPRVLLLVAVVHPPLLRLIAVPMTVVFVVGLAFVLWMARGSRALRDEPSQQVGFSNPLKLSTAVSFGLIFALVLVVVRAANEFFGSAGVFMASVLTGLTNMNAITLSVSELATLGQMAAPLAAAAIMMAVVVNILSKGVTAWVLGSAALRARTSRGFGLMLLAGIIGVVALWPGP